MYCEMLTQTVYGMCKHLEGVSSMVSISSACSKHLEQSSFLDMLCQTCFTCDDVSGYAGNTSSALVSLIPRSSLGPASQIILHYSRTILVLLWSDECLSSWAACLCWLSLASYSSWAISRYWLWRLWIIQGLIHPCMSPGGPAWTFLGLCAYCPLGQHVSCMWYCHTAHDYDWADLEYLDHWSRLLTAP